MFLKWSYKIYLILYLLNILWYIGFEVRI